MKKPKIKADVRYTTESMDGYTPPLDEIIGQLMPGDRVRAEFGPDLIIEGVPRLWGSGALYFGDSAIRHSDQTVGLRLTALTVLSLAPRPDPEPWWAGAEAVVDRDGAVWVKTESGTWGIAGETDWTSGAADGIEADYGPCTPIRQGGRTILSEAEIEMVAAVVLHGRKVGHALDALHGWRKEEK
ncbi:hypothetical protein ACQCX2_07680 [Propionibacteriaceae bacterium Y1700]|uniref:hypothetical protein n=1 Tax=Microlunatus sp. Y1700 TaxID=3418487 RepID=UPI003DA6EB94